MSTSPPVPRHSPLVPPTVSTSPSVPRHSPLVPPTMSTSPSVPRHSPLVPPTVSTSPPVPRHSPLVPPTVSTSPPVPRHSPLVPPTVSTSPHVPRHSPLVPRTVSTLHLSLDTVHSSLLRCPPLHLSLDGQQGTAQPIDQYIGIYRYIHSSGAVWESRWTSWAVRPNDPSGFRGRKELLNRASALVTTCP